MELTKTLKIEIPEGYEIDKEESTFENIIFKKVKNKFSKNWEEFCKENVVHNECFIRISSDTAYTDAIRPRNPRIDLNYIPIKFGKPMLALMQLLTIREKEYTKGWEPDWENPIEAKCCIITEKNKIKLFTLYNSNYILSFPTEELRDEFYKNWKDLIEIAKPLL